MKRGTWFNGVIVNAAKHRLASCLTPFDTYAHVYMDRNYSSHAHRGPLSVCLDLDSAAASASNAPSSSASERWRLAAAAAHTSLSVRRWEGLRKAGAAGDLEVRP